MVMVGVQDSVLRLQIEKNVVQRVQQTEMNHNHVSQIDHMIMVDFCLSSLSSQVCSSPT